MTKKVIEGLELKSTVIPEATKKALTHKGVFLYGTQFNLPLVPPIFSQHILFSGGIGSGKTNAINQIVQQLIDKRTQNDVVIIFDSKGDFLNRFGNKLPDKVVISNDSDSTVTWNMFNEALMDYKRLGVKSLDENLMELASSLFQTIIEKDANNPFFTLAAKNVFYGLLKLLANKHLDEHLQSGGKRITNKTIYELSKLDSSKIAEMFSEPAQQKDLAQLVYYLGRRSKCYSHFAQCLDRHI